MTDQALRLLVRRRAGEVCEYCRLPQAASQYVRFHIEHIVARQHGGTSEADNLALACGFCNFQKGPNIASLDPETGKLIPLFHPRRDVWPAHFYLERYADRWPVSDRSRHRTTLGNERLATYRTSRRSRIAGRALRRMK